MLRKLELAEVENIYNEWLVKHFPANEVKPLINIKNMWGIGGYEAYGWFEDTLIGYAFMCKDPNEHCVLLDYFAILDDYRSMGYGSKILTALKELMPGEKALIIETEDVNKAKSLEEAEERIRRDKFYTKNGIIKTCLTATVYEADYRIWYMPINETLSEDDLRKEYDSIYRFMLSEKGYRNYFSISMY